MKIICRCLFFVFLFCSLLSCKKTLDRHCWMVLDNLGNETARICDKTESELLSSTSNYFGGAGLTACNYFIDEGEKFCWISQNNHRLENMNEHEMTHYVNCLYQGDIFQKTSCTCATWYQREKRLYKPANRTSYSNIISGRYCGNSASASYHQPYIRKDDADSLITVQVSSDGLTFY